MHEVDRMSVSFPVLYGVTRDAKELSYFPLKQFSIKSCSLYMVYECL